MFALLWRSRLFQYICSFFLWLIIIAPFSFFKDESMLGLLKYLFYFFSFLFAVFVLALAAMPVEQNEEDPDDVFAQAEEISVSKLIYIGFAALSLLSLFMSIHGIWQFFNHVPQLAGWDDPNYLTGQTRVYSIMGNPNLLSAFLLAVIPMNFGMLLKAIEKSQGFYLVILAGILSSNTLALFFTGSRSAMLAFIFAGLVFAVFFLKTKSKINYLYLGLALILLAGLAFWLNPDLLKRFMSIFMWDGYSTNNYRIQVWLKSLEIIKENWILGIGLGNDVFRKVYSLYMIPGFEALSAYSVFLQVLIEAGFLGLLLFLTILTKSIKVLIRVFKQNQYLALIIFASISSLMVQGLFDTVFFRPHIQIVFWFMMACLVVFDVFENEVQKVN